MSFCILDTLHDIDMELVPVTIAIRKKFQKYWKTSVIFFPPILRYLVALKRARPPETKSGESNGKKKVLTASVWGEGRVGRGAGAERATLGLARVGSRAALNFAFAFLRRAWRSGEDADLCTELLQVIFSFEEFVHYLLYMEVRLSLLKFFD